MMIRHPAAARVRVHTAARATSGLGHPGGTQYVTAGDPQFPHPDSGAGAHADVVTGHLLVAVAALPNQRVDWLGWPHG